MYYYSHNIGDYRKETTHLSLLEHGIYRQLLDTAHMTEKPLTSDLDELMRTHCIRTEEEKQALKNVLKDFFNATEDGYVHLGVVQNIDQFRSKSVKASAAAKVRWGSPSDNNQDDFECLMQTHTKRNAHGMLTINQKPLTKNQKTNNHSISSPEASGDTQAAIRIQRPACPHREIIDLYNELLPTNPQVRPESWAGSRANVLNYRWKEKYERQDISWWLNLFTYIRYSSFLTGRVEPSGGREQAFTPNLDWILKLSNFTKIMEGLYHNPSEQTAYERDFRGDDET